ncbi:opine metallophore biosynthesis dehydrogenase [Fictibacillus norfolkensis]|uniref:Opine metallophore biosynthesis dehydrogenase n=1 Tax=Fictibacillus norfolkensis TaxID=2762233 RepID=A0ABR8SJ27_9BACL|nr:opine metallophore biosynthesis dehydrogenase [Fictibacillus norfolkensis]MBD7963487.1 opine metallophore biosynthesis dehydrogenase [Fictibacillus norfolkensis]
MYDVMKEVSEIVNDIRPSNLGNTLIAGAGPAAIQTAVQLYSGFSERIGLYNRPGVHAQRIKKELIHNNFEVSLTIQGKETELTAKIDCFFDDVSQLSDEWDTVILATPCTSYVDVIESLQTAELKRVRTIVLLAPNIGSNDLVKNLLLQETIEVISMSTYYAATKFHADSAVTAHTKAFKKRIYLGSSKSKSRMVNTLQEFLKSMDIDGEIVGQPLDAECRNITTYVHSAFFLNRFTLDEIFSLHMNGKKYMYKLFPEGPITPQRIKIMVRLWKEISTLMNELGAKPINLLPFLNDDNYPVPTECIQREDIDNFSEYEEVKQEYLLYIRYASILIDPFSKPDHEGRYFEFSAVPFIKAEEEDKGVWSIPRIPFEDYQKLIVIYGLAENSGIPMPEMKRLIKNFESECKQIETLLGIKESLIEARRESSLREVTNIMKERKRRLQ